MFEVDEAVNKIRAEVDTEAELIFGSIEDENLNGKIRVSIVATSLDGQIPQSKPIVSMVHRLQTRNAGYVESSISPTTANQSTLNATEGATALDLNTMIDNINVPEVIKNEELDNIKEPSLENISMESAAYIENKDMETFEVDSIQLATPDLFSENLEKDSYNQDNNEFEPQIFDNSKLDKQVSEQETEMFEESNLEEDFEIPAFLRRQKN
jgi:cell division protein FtsZ